MTSMWHYLEPHLKNIIERSLALFILIVISPLLGVVMLMLKLADKQGSILFDQARIGLKGKEFRCLKLRSMRENADQLLEQWRNENNQLYKDYVANNFKLENDPRVLGKVGNFIRAWSIDELPQLINVLKGDMSLIGPRPLLPREVAAYGSDNFKVYCSKRPGITGLWQVSGRSRTTFKTRVELDIQYINNWTLWLDVYILFKTIKVVITRDGAQ